MALTNRGEMMDDCLEDAELDAAELEMDEKWARTRTAGWRVFVFAAAVVLMFVLIAWGGAWYFAGMFAMSVCKDLGTWAKKGTEAMRDD